MKMPLRGDKKKILGVVGFLLVISIMALVYIYRDFFSKFVGLGFLGLFVACFVTNATVLLPAPSIVAVIEFAFIYNPVLVGIVGGFGAATGELIGYIAGRSCQNVFEFDHNTKLFRAFQKCPALLVVLFSLVPWPIFDVIGIMAGIVRMKAWKFYILCIIGKVLKMLIFALGAILIKEYYPSIFEVVFRT